MKHKHRGIRRLLALALLVGMAPLPQARAAASYSVDQALAYAEDHWDDGVGLCAEFVSKCVRAGGVNMTVHTTVGKCMNAAAKAAGLEMKDLKLTSDGYATKANNSSILARGDIVAQYCYTHDKYPHVMICGGYNSKGQATFYAHNGALQNGTFKLGQSLAYEHTKACNMQARVLRLSTLDGGGTVPAVTPKVSFSEPTDPAYAAKQKVTDTNAVLVSKVVKPSGVRVSRMGVILYESNSANAAVLKKYSEAVGNVGDSTTTYHSWFDVNKELGVTLTPGTIYRYQFFGVFDGVEVTGGKYTLLTTGEPLARQYTATFLLNEDGSASTLKAVTQGKAYGTLPTPYEKAGYTFSGWYTARTGGTQVTASTVFSGSSNVTVYPRFVKDAAAEPQSYIASFHLSENMAATVRVTPGSEYGKLPEAKAREGYTFSGWYTAETGGTQVTAHTIFNGSSDVDLYPRYTRDAAQPEPETYTVAFIDLTNMLTYGKYTVKNGDKYTIPSRTPTREGYVFEGWYTAASGGSRVTGATVANLTGDQNLYAHWKAEAGPEGNTITLQIGSPYLYINGRRQTIDDLGTRPVARNNRTLLPVRAVVEAMGGTVGWDAGTQIVPLTWGGKSLYLQLGNMAAWDNQGKYYKLDVAPVAINNRTMLPIRFIVEYFGGTVGWEAGTQTVTIQYQ